MKSLKMPIWNNSEATKTRCSEVNQESSFLHSIKLESHAGYFQEGRFSNSSENITNLIHKACVDGDIEQLTQVMKQGSLLCDQLNSLDQEGLSPLHYAAQYGRTNILQMLLEAGADPDIKGSPHGITIGPLQFAVKYNNLDCCYILIQYGANVLGRTCYGLTALHFAARRGSNNITKLLLKEGKMPVDVTDHDNSTSLQLAAQNGQKEVAATLIEYGANISVVDNDGFTAFHYAARDGHEETLKLLIQKAQNTGVNFVTILNSKENDGNSCLHLAVKSGSFKMVELCLKSGADILICVQESLQTPLHLACIHGLVEIARLLIAYGANLDCKDVENMTPLHRACAEGHVKVAEFLLNQGADATLQGPCSFSALHIAAKRSQTSVIKFLLDRGFPVNLLDSTKQTCLHVAVTFSEADTIKCILENGGKSLVNQKDILGKTPVHCASLRCCSIIMTTLVKAGGDIGVKDGDGALPLHFAARDGNFACIEMLFIAAPETLNETCYRSITALHDAARNGHVKICEYLLQQGADIEFRDEDRTTPLFHAARGGCPLTTKFLIERGAKINSVDKNRFTPLLKASCCGSAAVVRTLLNHGADITAVHSGNYNCLDIAISQGHFGVVKEILTHDRWRDAFKNRKVDGFSPMKRLIEKMPHLARLVMDKCIESSPHVNTDPQYSITYNFEYLNPPPSEARNDKGETYFGPKIMLQCKYPAFLLFHPLTTQLMRTKWKYEGLTFLYMFTFLYFVFLVTLSMYVVCRKDISKNENGKPLWMCCSAVLYSQEVALLVMSSISLLHELIQSLVEKSRYINLTNAVQVATFITTIILVGTPGHNKENQKELASACVLLAYINMLLYVQNLFDSGIYVTMLFEVMRTFCKVVFLFSTLLIAFGIAFMVLFQDETSLKIQDGRQDGRHEYPQKKAMGQYLKWEHTDSFTRHLEEYKNQAFKEFHMALVKVMTMMIGEIEYARYFVDSPHYPRAPLFVIIFLLFCALMPILVMNLLIGLAVGDIDTIQKNAQEKRLADQIEVVYHFEKNMPSMLTRWLYKPKEVIYPNGLSLSSCHKILCILGLRTDTKVSLPENDENDSLIHIQSSMQKHDKKLKDIKYQLEQQKQILDKLLLAFPNQSNIIKVTQAKSE